MNNLDLTMLVAGTVLLAALAVILGWRRAYREYPMFFAYVLGSLLIGLLRLSVRKNYLLYFEVYWITDALLVFAGLLALYEVFRRVFRAFFSLYSWFWALFPCVIVLVASVATIHALRHPPIQAIP